MPFLETRTPVRGGDLDRYARRPLWQQVADALEADLDGHARHGIRLESEAALGRRLGVSRVTVRQALSHLAERGVVSPQAGRGWFVTEPDERAVERPRPPVARRDGAGDGAGRQDELFEPPGQLLSFTEMARSRGLATDSVVLGQVVRPATLDEAELLSVAPGAALLSLRRLRRLAGLPVAVDHSLVPAALLPDSDGIDFAVTSLYDALRGHGVRPRLSHYEVQAEAASDEVAAMLLVSTGFPVLAARQVVQDVAGRPIERGHITYRGDRYRFRAVLRA